MITMAALQSDTTGLRTPGYEVTSINPALQSRIPELKRALDSGVWAFPDPAREDFYDVELPMGWAYIHVRNDNRTVYLVAYSRA